MNYGLDLKREEKEQDGTEYVFGAYSPECALSVKIENRVSSLPKGELQRGQEDFMDCVTRGYLNILETKFTYYYRNSLLKPENKVWLFNNGFVVFHEGDPYVEFSDRFIAIKSNTTRQGNSLKAPAHAIHKYGLIPKSLLPPSSSMTFDEYHDDNSISKEMLRIGQEFIERFPIEYEKVNTKFLDKILLQDFVGLAGYAWPTPVDGQYLKTKNKPNHAFMGFGLPKTNIFDNYVDSVDGDWIKKLAEDYNFHEYGYRIYVVSKTHNRQVDNVRSLIARIKRVFAPALGSSKKTRDAMLKIIEDLKRQIQVLYTRLRNKTVYQTALTYLGTDPTPADLIDDVVACAEVVTTILRRHVDMPIIPGTWTLLEYLKTSPKFKEVSVYMPGNIAIAATGTGNGKIRGHVWIVGKNNLLLSNDSYTGKFSANYTIQTARDRYEKHGGMKLRFFALT